MPEIEISKIKTRRGTDTQRKLITFEQGELAYALDTKRLFVGNGVTLGGDVVGNKIHPPLLNTYSLTTLKAEVGDIAAVNNIFYQLNDPDYSDISNWTKFRFNVDTIVFGFDNTDRLLLNNNSISAKYIDSSTVSNGVKIESGILQSSFQTKCLEISAFKLSIKESGIDEREISSTTLSNGLTGGSGSKIKINANPAHFYFNVSNQLSLSGFNPFTLKFSDINSLWIGDGLNYNPLLSTITTNITNINGDGTIVSNGSGEIGLNTAMFGAGLTYDDSITPTLTANVADVDGISIINTGGTIKINDGVIPGTNILSKTTIDTYGRLTSQTSSIVSALTGNSSTNSNNSLSAIFNGSIIGEVPGLKTTQFTAISSNGSTLTLSSAGFITFEGPSTTQEGQTIKRFAIPIFSY